MPVNIPWGHFISDGMAIKMNKDSFIKETRNKLRVPLPVKEDLANKIYNGVLQLFGNPTPQNDKDTRSFVKVYTSKMKAVPEANLPDGGEAWDPTTEVPLIIALATKECRDMYGINTDSVCKIHTGIYMRNSQMTIPPPEDDNIARIIFNFGNKEVYILQTPPDGNEKPVENTRIFTAPGASVYIEMGFACIKHQIYVGPSQRVNLPSEIINQKGMSSSAITSTPKGLMIRPKNYRRVTMVFDFSISFGFVKGFLNSMLGEIDPSNLVEKLNSNLTSSTDKSNPSTTSSTDKSNSSDKSKTNTPTVNNVFKNLKDEFGSVEKLVPFITELIAYFQDFAKTENIPKEQVTEVDVAMKKIEEKLNLKKKAKH